MTLLCGGVALHVGHDHFFKGKEDTYDIREAYKCTVVTFGPDVVYDCPVKKMGEQLSFLKYGLTHDKFHSYVPVIQQEVCPCIYTYVCVPVRACLCVRARRSSKEY